MTRRGTEARRARLVLVALLVALALWIVREFLPALAWAVIIAVAIDPLYLRLRGRWNGRIARVLLPAAITLAVALVVLVPLLFAIGQALAEARQIAQGFEWARNNGIAPPAWLDGTAPFARSWWQAHLADPHAPGFVLGRMLDVDVVMHGRLIGSNLMHRAVVFAFTLMTLFFLLRDRDTIVEQCLRASDRVFGPAGERIGRQAINSVRATIDGLVLVGIGEGAVMTIVYSVLGTPHPIMLGALTAVAATIPFGAAVMFAVAAALQIAMGSPVNAGIIVVSGLIVLAVADHLIRPAIIGGATRLPFLWVLIGILGGAATFGILGLFVGPATMAVLVMLWRDFADGSGQGGEAPSE